MLSALCEGNPPGTGGSPSQRASNVTSVPVMHINILSDDLLQKSEIQ